MTFIELIFRYLKGSNLPAACAFMGFILSMFYFMSVYSEVILDKNIYLYYWDHQFCHTNACIVTSDDFNAIVFHRQTRQTPSYSLWVHNPEGRPRDFSHSGGEADDVGQFHIFDLCAMIIWNMKKNSIVAVEWSNISSLSLFCSCIVNCHGSCRNGPRNKITSCIIPTCLLFPFFSPLLLLSRNRELFYLIFFQLNLMILSHPGCTRSYGCLCMHALLTLKQVKVTETDLAV